MQNRLDIYDDGHRERARLDLTQINGLGRINPRLQLVFEGQPSPHCKIQLTEITLRLESDGELIGESRVTGVDISSNNSHVVFEVVVSPRVLRHITNGIGSTSTVIQMDATLRGQGQLWIDPTAPQIQGFVEAEPGQWKDIRIREGSRTTLQIPRGDWYESIIGRVNNDQFLYLEIALPRGGGTLGAEWRNAVDLLHKAEQAYVSGDDASVFVHLRGAQDALPGAKQAVLSGITDEKKRYALDTILKQTGAFFHSGRHVATEGVDAGSFPVDHLDAAFALDLMRVLLSHLSLLLSAEKQRAGA